MIIANKLKNLFVRIQNCSIPKLFRVSFFWSKKVKQKESEVIIKQLQKDTKVSKIDLKIKEIICTAICDRKHEEKEIKKMG